MKITRKTNIKDVVSENPEIAEIFSKKGFGCIGCVMAQFETIEQGCKAHGLNDKAIDEIIKEIKNKIK